ncbi:MAG: hybrid sensor histidine kinase/response regulator, partial [Hyphomicrobium sp.]|nr:hybrid sensor histidine kinase/response regulator [Hyphomicrobium sp.]
MFDLHPLGGSPEELERRIRKLQKINAALMQRVERSMDAQANAYSLFQTA